MSDARRTGSLEAAAPATTGARDAPERGSRAESTEPLDVRAYYSTDSRRMCFDQGKPFVHMPSEESEVVITEWPNGVIDEFRIDDESMTRSWPDGRHQRFTSQQAKTPLVPRL